MNPEDTRNVLNASASMLFLARIAASDSHLRTSVASTLGFSAQLLG
jgi:hypothetical protein